MSPTQDQPPRSHRRPRRTAWRAATVLAPVLVVGVPVGAIAARDPVPTLDRLAAALQAPAEPQPAAAAASSLVPAAPVSAPLSAPVSRAATSERVECEAGSACAVTPPEGADTAFEVEARGGTSDAVLTAELNSGTAPDCANYSERSGDWVRVGFADPEAGATWHKFVSLTDRHPLGRAAALRQARVSEICFSAPYRFRTKRGYPLTAVADGSGELQGVLAACRPGRRDDPPSPCLLKRTVAKAPGGWVVRLVAFTPARAEDPAYRG
jgi:hypothetical protein